ncbi:AcrR family transcriptional regulator [Bradyrhizobium sp. USDA 4461]
MQVRERDGDIRERVLFAGFEALKELGFDGASTLEIATRAKVSKRELYALFKDKQSIAVECIKWRAQQMQLPLELPRPTDRQTLLAVLIKFGAVLVSGVCDPNVLAVFRFAISEFQRAPEIAQALNERGREPSRKKLIELIKNAQESGLLLPAPPAEICEFFFSVLWGDLQIRLLMGLAKPPTKAEIDQRAKQATERLMAAYAKSA